jgi:hypothetical protein
MSRENKVVAKGPPLHWKEWASVLELSCMWQMDHIRDMATKRILEQQADVDEWSCLLKLATRQDIRELRDPAIQNLSETLAPIDKILLGMECQVHTWLIDGYSSLAQKSGGITLEDEKLLGQKTTSRLFRIREIVFLPVVAEGFMMSEVKRLFTEELKHAGWDGR